MTRRPPCRINQLNRGGIHRAQRRVDIAGAMTAGRETLPGMELRSYEYRDPGRVLADVAAQCDLVEGDALLAVVRDPSTDQHVVHVSRLDAREWDAVVGYDRSELLYEAMHSMPVPALHEPGPPRHSVMTIVARRGFAVLGRREAEWLMAWRYSNHLLAAFTGDLILVTEHGWTDFMTGMGGPEPRLALATTERALG
jgi:hypothetical protein